jgi:lipopolysaccharide biosynthesis regulator YciM
MVVIHVGDYEIISNSSFLLLSFTLTLLLLINVVASYYILIGVNKNKYLKKNKKIQMIYEKYIELITKGFLHSFNNNIKSAEYTAKQAEKTVKNNNLTRFLRGQILLNKQKYQESIDVIKTIKNDKIGDLNYFINNIMFAQAVNQSNRENIKLYGKKVLEEDKSNRSAIVSLYKIYREELNWVGCNDLLVIIKKHKIFSKEEIKNEGKIIDLNLNNPRSR